MLGEIGKQARARRNKKSSAGPRAAQMADFVPVLLAGNEELEHLHLSTWSASLPADTWECYSLGNPSRPNSAQLHRLWYPSGTLLGLQKGNHICICLAFEGLVKLCIERFCPSTWDEQHCNHSLQQKVCKICCYFYVF